MILNKLTIGIKGAGEMASAVAWRLYTANFKRIFMMEVRNPLAVRREVSFCEAVHEGNKVVEEVKSVRTESVSEIREAWDRGEMAVIVDPEWKIMGEVKPEVTVDAILAKRNLGTSMDESQLSIALGPGFVAGKDAHLVIETNRGHNLGRVLTSGSAEPNTGIPGSIGGYAAERVVRAPVEGVFEAVKRIGEQVKKNDIVGKVDSEAVRAGIDGVIRGLIRNGSQASKGLKLGDIDPRGEESYCYTISDKARAIGGSVLEAVLGEFNK